jgi:hypothetical protein
MDILNKCHVMIDLETYGLAHNSVFRSIAAVLFSFNPNDDKTQILIDSGVHIEEQLMYGSVIDQSTINFWRDQPKELRDLLLSKKQETMHTVLCVLRDEVIKYTSDYDTVYIWSHGSNFDTVLLDSAYKAFGIKPFWKYKHVRDTRTLFDLAGYNYESKGGHDALEDTMRQVNAIREAFKQLVHGGINGGSLYHRKISYPDVEKGEEEKPVCKPNKD